MLYIKDGLNFHNFNLDCKPKTWFRRIKGETVDEWLCRTAYQGEDNFLSKMKWREANEYWLDTSFDITMSILSFLRENEIEKETFEDLVGFEVDLKGWYLLYLWEIFIIIIFIYIRCLRKKYI